MDIMNAEKKAQINKLQMTLATFSCATFFFQHAEGDKRVIEALGISFSVLKWGRIISILFLGISAMAAWLIARKKENIICGLPAALLNISIGITFLIDTVYIFVGQEYIQLFAVLLKLPLTVFLILSRCEYDSGSEVKNRET